MKFIKLFLLAGLITWSACNEQPKDGVDAAKEANYDRSADDGSLRSDTAATTQTTVDESDADFAVEAANGGMMEVEMGKLATAKASSQRVKDFGAMMVRDHGKAGEELSQLAAQKNIVLPASLGADAQKHLDKLNEKTGKDFDKAYMDMMLDDHKKDIDKFEKAAKECKDGELKSFATKTLPVLYVHLDSAKAITGKK